MPYTIKPATSDDAQVGALLLRHMQMMQAGSPPESCHVMDPARFSGRARFFWRPKTGMRFWASAR